MNKKRTILTVIEALSGILSVIALVGNLVVDTKEAKQIGCDENAGKNE